MIVLEVAGTPEPKGSYRAIVVGKRRPPTCACRAVLIPSGDDKRQKALDAWKRAVLASIPGFEATLRDVPLAVSITFRIARPAGHYRANGQLKPSAPRYPRWKPDGDKLLRSTLDALSAVAFDDDARIVDLHAFKRYADGTREGATIEIAALYEIPAVAAPAAQPGANDVSRGSAARVAAPRLL